MKLVNLRLADKNPAIRKSLVEIAVLKGSLVILISRNGHYFVPSGGTTLEAGDVLQVLAEKEKISSLKEFFAA
jgi:cell volume regulation protein A